ncbi:MAG: EscU/YscU/HrcU family type III secretion system export apparatus switch protein [Polyangiaceae bacterium]
MSEQTEEATPRRRERARREGDSGASLFASRSAGLFAAIALLPAAAFATATWFDSAMRAAISQIGKHAPLAFDAAPIGRAVLALTAPLLLATAATTAVATLAQTGGVLALGKLAPRLDRLNLVSGFGQLFSAASAVATLRAVGFGFAAIAIVVLELRAHALDFAHLAGRPDRIGPFVLAMTLQTWEKAAFVGLGIAAIDIVVSRILWARRIRMTKEEVAREQRETQGDPQIKEARRRAFEALVSSSANIDEATLLVTDGRRVACALRYEKETGGAPTVLAIGRDLLRSAAAKEIPVEMDADLAAALSRLDVGAAIPEALYDRVADLLAEMPTK